MDVYALLWTDGYTSEVEGIFSSENNAYASVNGDKSCYRVEHFILDEGLEYKQFSIAESRITSCLRLPKNQLGEVARKLLTQALDDFQE